MNDLTLLENAIYRHLLDKALENRANGVKPENILFSEFVKDFTHALMNLEAKKMLYIGDTIFYESEDEKIRKWIRKELESKYVVDNIVNNEMADKALAWLEKQGEQSHWKPTEEQLQTIHAQMNEGAVTYPDDKRVLTTLYEDLMKITTQEEKQVEQKESLCEKCRGEISCEWEDKIMEIYDLIKK